MQKLNFFQNINKIYLVIFILGFLIRVATLFLFEMEPIESYGENGQIASRILEGIGHNHPLYGHRSDNPLISFMPPLYTWILLFFLSQFSNAPLALGFFHAVLSIFSAILLTLFIFKLIQNSFLTLLSTIAITFYPPIILSIIRPQTLTVNIFLISGLLFCSVMILGKRPYFWAIFTGIFIGLTILTRPMFILYIPILFVWLWLNLEHKKTAIFSTLTTLIFALLLITPWTIRNYRAHNNFVYISTNGGFNFWTGNNEFTTGSGHEVYTQKAYTYLNEEPPANLPEIIELHRYPLPPSIRTQIDTLNELELDQLLYQETFQFIRENPQQWFDLLIVKARGFFWFRDNIGARYEENWTQYYKLIYGFVFALTIAGLALSIKQWRKYSLLYMLFGYYGAFYTFFHIQTRYRWEIESLFLLFVCLALYQTAVFLGLDRKVEKVLPKPGIQSSA